MTTEAMNRDDSERLARKAVIARSYTDPLGAKGFRKPFERIERERRARRLTAIAALASFAGVFGLFVATAPEPAPIVVSAETSSTSVVAEIPVPGANPGDPVTIVRIVMPD
ncbi:MAG: hypothetical protein AB7V46_02345, partial [Thermomicrobiales bacterium]